ncbi:unnamed protein product [Phytomonas sp. EM1]|nr:unnamed protein product [Phytomonas sp. EM1]|eukprot:CCW60760.1 unnamed protein product [Phytomonas sp. isolate EM1]
MCETNGSNANGIVFLGSGRRNIVLGVCTSELQKLCILPFSKNPYEIAFPYHVALRISDTPQRECEECARALKSFVGSRIIISMTPELRAHLSARVSPNHLVLLNSATEVMLLSNFTVNPAALLHRPCTGFPFPRAGTCAGLTADYTIEIKPKSAWRRPRVIGIEVDGQAHFLHPLKRTHCRYAMMPGLPARAGGAWRRGRDGRGGVLP